jgi:DNA-directed RNA polymerase specialized sigma24 family protein
MSAASWPAFSLGMAKPTAPKLTVSRPAPAAALTEAELIDGCLAGQATAQKQLYERYSARMMAVCLRYAQTTFEAEDVLQEGFVTVYRTLGSFRRECPLEFWIRRIMVNAALRQHRRNAPLVAVSDGDYPVVQELAPRYRLVFNLYAIEGYTHKEIGEMLEISEGTSKSQYSRARVVLQTKLARLHPPVN